MLDPWIIEEIRRREEEERARQEQRPTLEMPLESPAHPGSHGHKPPDKEEDRGVVIVDFSI